MANDTDYPGDRHSVEAQIQSPNKDSCRTGIRLDEHIRLWSQRLPDAAERPD